MLFGKNTQYHFIDKCTVNDNLCTYIFTVNDENEKYYYQGNISNDVWDGYGKLWSNIFTYNGYFKDGIPHGDGIYKYVGCTDNLKNEFVKSYKGQFKNGMKEGKGKEIYLNDELYIGDFHKSLRNGNGIYYATNGSKKIEGNWDMGYSKDTKSIIDYWDNGNIKYKGEFDKNKWNGKGVFCYPNGNICFDGTFKDSKPIKGIMKTDKGLKILEGSLIDKESCIIYMHNGNKFLEWYTDDDNTCTYLIKQYFDDGTLLFDGNIYHNHILDFNNIELLDMIKHINNLREVIKYNKGTFYHKGSNINNPKIKCICNYNQNNFLDGEYKLFLDDGTLFEHTLYNNNEKNENQKTFHPNGKPHIESNYIHDVLDGEYKEFSPNNEGSIIKQGVYLNTPGGEKNILKNAKIYNINMQILYEGDLDRIHRYTNNGKLYYDTPENTIKYEGSFHNNNYNGEGQLYFSNNSSAYQGCWLNGKRHGQGTSYYESTGTVEYIGVWLNDEKHGTGMLFNENSEQVWDGLFHNNEIHIGDGSGWTNINQPYTPPGTPPIENNVYQ